MKIAVCDDCPQDIERIGRYTLRMIEYANEYRFFHTPMELLEAYKEGYQPDMYILDIEMPGIDGLFVAKEIRTRDSKALIVFLTSYSKYMPDVFEVVTFDFISKPITEERLQKLFDKAETYLSMTNQSFSFRYRRSRYSLKYDDILYLEKKGRQAVIHTRDNFYQTNMNMEELWRGLDERVFASVHGSFIVNLKYIKTMNMTSVQLTNGIELSISRGFRKHLEEKYMLYVQGGM